MAEKANGKKFGVEIECCASETPNEVAAALRDRAEIDIEAQNYNHRTQSCWKIVGDGSVHPEHYGQYPMEIVSCPLKGEEGFKQIKTLADYLKANLGGTANRTCGLHVHINLKRSRSKDCRKYNYIRKELITNEVLNILFAYSRFEQAIDYLLPRSRRQNQYCQSINGSAYRLYDRAVIGAIKTIRDIRNYTGGRYHKVNIESYVQYHTIEFRQHNGSVDSEKIVKWIEFLQGFVKAIYPATVRHEFINPRNCGTIHELLDFVKPYVSKSTIKYLIKRYNVFAQAEGREQI